MVEERKFSKISVIIPAYYKRKLDFEMFIEETVPNILKIADDYEVVIVCSKEIQDLYRQVKTLSLKDSRIQLVNHDPKIGKEYAYFLEGFEETSADHILFIDPYSQLELDNLYILKKLMFQKDADIVIGSKSHPDSKVTCSNFRKITSKIYYRLIKSFLDLTITDTQTGLKLYKANVLKDVLPRIVTKKYAFDLEVLACASHRGFKIIEAPVEIKKTYRFESITLPHIYHTLIDAIAIYYRLKILKFYNREKPPLRDMPFVSILIATKEYNPNLEECIDKCRKLDYPNYEIIILPDEKMNPSIEGIVEIPTGEVFPPEKRDIGITHAKGEIIAFLDDDSFPTKRWIKSAVAWFNNEEIAAVGGPAVTPDDSSLRERASGAVYTANLVAGRENYRYIPKIPREVDDYPTCNLFVRKDILEKIGGFGTKFWPGEDTILCYKITKNLSKRIYYEPDALIYHRRRPLYLPHLKQVASYALHRGYFVKRYPETSFRLIYFIPSLFLVGLPLGGILAVIWPTLRIMYLSVTAIYVLLLLWIAIRCIDIRIGVQVSIGIFFTHLVYGWYFLKGLFAKRLAEEVE